MSPTAPLSLRIIERIITVLKAIVAGDDYFYTPYAVEKKFVHWEEASVKADKPLYMVFRDSGGRTEFAGTDLYDEHWFINIKGYVKHNSDTVTPLERAIRDIQKAINDDSKSGAAGSLGALGVQTTFEEPPTTDNGYLSSQGFGYFEQRVKVISTGDFGEL